MVNFVIKLADVNIGVTAQYDETKLYCAGYFSNDMPDFCVSVCECDIDFEIIRSAKNHRLTNEPLRAYSRKYLETLALYRKIAEKMIGYNTLLVHGSAVAVDNEAYLFTAKSGTGKSTHTRLWREYFGKRAVMVNDDKPLVKITADAVYVCGTPWNGKHKLGNNTVVPLKAICILGRDKVNHINTVNKKDVWQTLIRQTYRPCSAEGLTETLGLIDKMSSLVKIYTLGCNMDISAAEIAYNGMNEE